MGEWRDFPRSPCCDADDQDWWDGLEKQLHDGDEIWMSCGKCGADYRARACIDVTFLSYEPDAGEGGA